MRGDLGNQPRTPQAQTRTVDTVEGERSIPLAQRRVGSPLLGARMKRKTDSYAKTGKN